VVCTSPDLLLEPGGKEFVLGGFIDEVKPRRIVVDSLSHLQMYAEANDLRKEFYRLIMFLKTKRLSSILIWEAQGSSQTMDLTDTAASFLVDSIILLKPVEIESSMKTALAVLKLRGSDHDKQLREYEITKNGLRVSAPFIGYDSIMTGSAKRSPGGPSDTWASAFQQGKPKERAKA
jgi:circadian clock protein KaiC